MRTADSPPLFFLNILMIIVITFCCNSRSRVTRFLAASRDESHFSARDSASLFGTDSKCWREIQNVVPRTDKLAKCLSARIQLPASSYSAE